jgi:hypothetical protein
MPKIERADNRTNDARAGQKAPAILASAISRFKRMRVSRSGLLITVFLGLAIIAVIVAAVVIQGRGGNGQLVPTNIWMNFYGLNCTLDGQLLPVGSVVTVCDPEGILCGAFTVTQVGRYGLLPVYEDDPWTQVDEGAAPGDSLQFYINGVLATVTGPDQPVWTAMGDLKQVNLQASARQ